MLSSVPVGQRDVLELLDDPRRRTRAAVAEVEARRRAGSPSPARGLLGDRDRRQPEHDALERGRDRARVGDVVAEVGAVVDAGDDQVGLEALDQPERASRTQSTGVPSVA